MALLTMPTMIESMKMATNRIQKPALTPETAALAAVAMNTSEKGLVDESGGSIAFPAPLQPDSEVRSDGRPPLELGGHAASGAIGLRKPAGAVDPAADRQHPPDPDPAARKGIPAHHLLRQG